MSERATGRHRAPRRPTTPLTPLTTAVGERVNQINPAGLVVAVSSGLLATGGIPLAALHAPRASAETTQASAETTYASAETTQAVDAPPYTTTAFQESVLTSGAALTAPAAGDDPTFDRASFTAVPKPVTRPATAMARTAAVSRSAQRTAPTSRTVTSSKTVSKTVSKTASKTRVPSKVGSRVLAIAARYVGVPYVYGGRTPRGFDCSGYVQYVFRQAGVRLPRTADQQMRAGRHISRSKARPGDLVAFVSGGSAYHIGIYAGGNKMYDSPRPGKSVSKRSIWSAAVVFVRV